LPTEPSTLHPFHGALWTLALRWSDRLIGFVSTLILARLLLPDDFGVYALASIMVGLADVLLDLGVHIALIQDRDAQREDYDTAWTLRVLQSALAATLLVALAEPLAGLLGEPRLGALLPWLALALLLGSLENIGVVDFQKQQRFDRDFRFFFSKRLVGFVLTITLALMLRSYWALAAGTLGQRLAGVVLSYVLHSYRPRLSWRRAHKIWIFSRWILLQNVGVYLEQRLDKILVGKREPTALVGAYAVADEIAAMPGTELLAPLNRTLLPALAARMHEPAQVREMYLLALSMQCLLGFPASVGLAMVADRVVAILLGPNWTAAIALLEWLALGGVVAAMTASGRYLLLAAGRSRALAAISWLQIAVFLAVAILGFAHLTATGIAALRVVAGALAGIVILVLLFKRFPLLSIGDLMRNMLRPALATAVMALGLTGLEALIAERTGLMMLSTLVVGGVMLYVSAALGLWIIAGRPDGAERIILSSKFSDRRCITRLIGKV